MGEKENNEIPEFASPEEAREYWDERSLSTPERNTEWGKTQPGQKLDAQLSIPISAIDIGRLYNISVTLGADIDELVRQAIRSFIESHEKAARIFSPKAVKKPGERPLPSREKTAEERLDVMEGREEGWLPKEELELPKEGAGLPNEDIGVEMSTRTGKGTASLVTMDERGFLTSADYNIWENLWTEEAGGGWGGELMMMSEIPPGEYVIMLSEEDGRSGRIIISDMQENAGSETGFQTYRYSFRGVGALINEKEERF